MLIHREFEIESSFFASFVNRTVVSFFCLCLELQILSLESKFDGIEKKSSSQVLFRLLTILDAKLRFRDSNLPE